LLHPGLVRVMGSQMLSDSLHRAPKLLWRLQRSQETLLDLAVQREVTPGRTVNRLGELWANQDQRNCVGAHYLEVLRGNNAQPLKQRELGHDVYFAAAHR